MPLQVEIVSPEEELFSGEAEFVRARTVDGEIGILPGHIPVLAQLVSYDVKVRTSGGDQLYPIGGGFMSVKDDRVIILADERETEGQAATET
jgi:F-type H+-transporting ATPase subunit epsilon